MKRGTEPRARAPTADELGGQRQQRDGRRPILCTDSASGSAAPHRELQLVNLTLTTLDTVSRFSDAQRLVILDLHSNFLSDITGLGGCVNLVQLDLSDNQLTALPSANFWHHFARLRVLYLHNNAIAGQHGSAAAVESLAACRKLQILTLHRNPLAIIRGYRVYVTNMIWSLLALDHHVVADSEVVEGMVRHGMFAPCTERYSRPLYRRTTGDFDADFLSTCHLIANVAAQQRRHSPIQIVQRAVRQFLIRRAAQRAKSAEWKELDADTPLDIMSPEVALTPPESAPAPPAIPQRADMKIEVDVQKLLNHVEKTFAGHEDNPRSEYLEWVKLNVLDGGRRASATISVPTSESRTDGLHLPSFETKPHGRRRSAGYSPWVPAPLSPSLQPGRTGPSDGAADGAGAAVEINGSEEMHIPTFTRLNSARSYETRAGFLRPLVTREARRAQQTREQVDRVRLQKRVANVKRAEARARESIAEKKAEALIPVTASRMEDDMAVKRHAAAVKAAQDQLRQDYTAKREDVRHRQAELDYVLNQRRAQLAADSTTDKVERVEKYRELTAKDKICKTAVARMRREALERARADVHAALRERRRDQAHNTFMTSKQLERQREKLTSADLERRRRIVEHTRETRQPAVATRDAARRAASSRGQRPSLQGLPSTPAKVAVIPHRMPVHLFREPGADTAVVVKDLTPESYPQSMWSQLPAQMVIDARLRELESRWNTIGDYCVLDRCRTDPVHACRDCFPKFRSFVTMQVSDAVATANANSRAS